MPGSASASAVCARGGWVGWGHPPPANEVYARTNAATPLRREGCDPPAGGSIDSEGRSRPGPLPRRVGVRCRRLHGVVATGTVGGSCDLDPTRSG